MIGKRAIAFDIGNKRIGVAVSDPFNEYAMPCETYHRTGKFYTDVEAIAKIAAERGVGVIVCGIPYNFDGTESIQTTKTQEFIEALRQKTELPVVLEDERFTTMQARETQIAGGIKREDRKKTIDSIAASYILESYLSREKQKNKKAEEQAMAKKDEFIYEDEDRIIEFESEDGVLKLYLLAKFPYKGQEYCAFQKAEPETEEEEDEVVIFEMQTDEETGDAIFNWIEDDLLLDEVFAEFCRLYEDFEDADEAASLDK